MERGCEGARERGSEGAKERGRKGRGGEVKRGTMGENPSERPLPPKQMRSAVPYFVAVVMVHTGVCTHTQTHALALTLTHTHAEIHTRKHPLMRRNPFCQRANTQKRTFLLNVLSSHHARTHPLRVLELRAQLEGSYPAPLSAYRHKIIVHKQRKCVCICIHTQNHHTQTVHMRLFVCKQVHERAYMQHVCA